MIEGAVRWLWEAIAAMSMGESLDNAPDRYDPTTYIQLLQFKLRCYEASGDEFQRLFEEIIKRARPEFMQIRPYGNIGDRKCDGFLPADGTIFQVYSPDEDGILQKLARESDRYLFLHRTFQEYLTASYLNRASNSIALAREHFWEYEWHETLSLLAGLMGNPVPLLQAITDEKDDIFSTLLLLAGRCIAECPENPHSLIAEIIDKIYKFWHSYPNASFIESTLSNMRTGVLEGRWQRLWVKLAIRKW